MDTSVEVRFDAYSSFVPLWNDHFSNNQFHVRSNSLESIYAGGCRAVKPTSLPQVQLFFEKQLCTVAIVGEKSVPPVTLSNDEEGATKTTCVDGSAVASSANSFTRSLATALVNSMVSKGSVFTNDRSIVRRPTVSDAHRKRLLHFEGYKMPGSAMISNCTVHVADIQFAQGGVKNGRVDCRKGLGRIQQRAVASDGSLQQRHVCHTYGIRYSQWASAHQA